MPTGSAGGDRDRRDEHAHALFAKDFEEWLATTGITVTGTSVGTRQQMAQLLALHAVNPLISEVIEIGLSALSTALHSLAAGQVKGRFCVVF